MITPSHIANFFLDKAEEEEIGISPMKLLKLVYIGYGWMIAALDEPPFDEAIEAWEHGPVVPSLYHEFKHYRKDSITCRSGLFDLEDSEYTEPRIPDKDEGANIVLSKVWDAYKYFDAWALRNKTHEEDTPWSETYVPGKNIPIPPERIKTHFNRKIREYLNASG